MMNSVSSTKIITYFYLQKNANLERCAKMRDKNQKRDNIKAGRLGMRSGQKNWRNINKNKRKEGQTMKLGFTSGKLNGTKEVKKPELKIMDNKSAIVKGKPVKK